MAPDAPAAEGGEGGCRAPSPLSKSYYEHPKGPGALKEPLPSIGHQQKQKETKQLGKVKQSKISQVQWKQGSATETGKCNGQSRCSNFRFSVFLILARLLLRSHRGQQRGRRATRNRGSAWYCKELGRACLLLQQSRKLRRGGIRLGPRATMLIYREAMSEYFVEIFGTS